MAPRADGGALARPIARICMVFPRFLSAARVLMFTILPSCFSRLFLPLQGGDNEHRILLRRGRGIAERASQRVGDLRDRLRDVHHRREGAQADREVRKETRVLRACFGRLAFRFVGGVETHAQGRGMFPHYRTSLPRTRAYFHKIFGVVSSKCR